MRITKIEVLNFKRIETAEIDVDNNKLLLFGPNGAGKTSLIHALLTLLGYISEESGVENIISGLLARSPQSHIRLGADKATISAVIDGKKYSLEIDRFAGTTLYVDGERKDTTLRFSLSYLAPCVVRNSVDEELWEISLCPPGINIRDPRIAELVRREIYLLGIEDFYFDMVKERGHWINLRDLAYGLVRVLGLLLAIYGEPEILILDTFEAGMHYDLAVDVIKFLTSLPSFVILESHIGLSVKAALKRGWSVYYVKEGEFIRIRNMDELKNIAYAEARAFAEA
ncbi:AAA family ATPase [Pyrobaculum ferrireducens]|uniref:ATP-binding cassette domain-containing protein n=1 Tax=Pyrobaculum ferrireducens TaxID=1104324 RepID=G7VBW3_9CREN|nr:AAA family ATPase [Pyrobaculum ferrireducens]AET32463.1 hypothetical protein P186_1026 [Pyrobaculum ferrireducens]